MADRATECEYEIGGTPHGSLDHSQFLFWNGPDPSGSKDTHTRWVVREAVSEPPTNLLPVATKTQLPPEMVLPVRALVIHSLAHNSLLPSGPPPHANEVRRYNLPRVALPSFSAVSSLVIPTIPPESHDTSPPLGAGRFQLSDVALGDLDMKLYVSRIPCLSMVPILFISVG